MGVGSFTAESGVAKSTSRALRRIVDRNDDSDTCPPDRWLHIVHVARYTRCESCDPDLLQYCMQ